VSLYRVKPCCEAKLHSMFFKNLMLVSVRVFALAKHTPLLLTSPITQWVNCVVAIAHGGDNVQREQALVGGVVRQ
jgi:hypothetical protein